MRLSISRFAAAIICWVLSLVASAQTDTKPDGWYTWNITTVSSAPDWCCYDWDGKTPAMTVCDLDQPSFSYGSNSETQTNSDRAKIYARKQNGELLLVRVLSSHCPVESDSSITNIGTLTTDQSLQWLKPYALGTSEHASDALAAIALHEGDAALRLLQKTAREHTLRETRKNAVFWLAQIRLDQSRAFLKDVMLNDNSEQIRRHALFSYAQSKAQDRDSVLISVIENPKFDRDERKNALFWLVQTESSAAINYVSELLQATD